MVRPSGIPEVPLVGEAPRAFGERMAREKALAARRATCDPILAADTVVAVGAEILGKPDNAEDAKRMLRLLAPFMLLVYRRRDKREMA